MTWIYLGIGLGVAGLAVIGAVVARVVVAARGLNREIARVHQQFSLKADLRG